MLYNIVDIHLKINSDKYSARKVYKYNTNNYMKINENKLNKTTVLFMNILFIVELSLYTYTKNYNRQRI
jgi:hypothetical protein